MRLRRKSPSPSRRTTRRLRTSSVSRFSLVSTFLRVFPRTVGVLLSVRPPSRLPLPPPPPLRWRPLAPAPPVSPLAAAANKFFLQRNVRGKRRRIKIKQDTYKQSSVIFFNWLVMCKCQLWPLFWLLFLFFPYSIVIDFLFYLPICEQLVRALILFHPPNQ